MTHLNDPPEHDADFLHEDADGPCETFLERNFGPGSAFRERVLDWHYESGPGCGARHWLDIGIGRDSVELWAGERHLIIGTALLSRPWAAAHAWLLRRAERGSRWAAFAAL